MRSLAHAPLLLLTVVALMTACRAEYDKTFTYKHLPEAEWLRGQELVFQFFVDCAASRYDIALLLRINNDFDRLELPITYKLSNNISYLRTAQATFEIAKSAGDFSNFRGGYRQYILCIEAGIAFPMAGIYTLTLTTDSQLPKIRGIENIGFVATHLTP